MYQKNHIIYTDGSCKTTSNSPGGWAFFNENKTHIESGFSVSTNCTQMEIKAVIEALHYIRKQKIKATIVTDHKGIFDAVTNDFFNWEENNWNSNGGEVKNLQEWQELKKLWEMLKKRQNLCIHWTPSHQGEHGNELVDKFAKKERAKAEIFAEMQTKSPVKSNISRIQRILDNLKTQTQKANKQNKTHIVELEETAVLAIKQLITS